MTKWEQVFTETLASLVSGKGDELYRLWLDKNLELEAKSMCCIASIIASEATRTMVALQPLERSERAKSADKPIEKDSFWTPLAELPLTDDNGKPIKRLTEQTT